MNSGLFDKEEINTEDKPSYFVQPGYIFVSREPHLLSTVLGSCISVCIWDPVLKFGGMNHYIHAKPFNKKEKSAKYASLSIPYLIKTMVEIGSKKYNLKGHIVGGSQNPKMGSIAVGRDNILIAETLLKQHYIDIITFDTGGELGRKVVFDTETGEIVIYKVNKLREYDWYADKSFNNR